MGLALLLVFGLHQGINALEPYILVTDYTKTSSPDSAAQKHMI